MNCDRVQLLLNPYIDGELDLVSSLEIEEHLQECASCARRYQELLAVHTAASNTALSYAVPAGLEQRIRTSVRKANPAPPAWAQLPWNRLAPAVGLAAVLLILVVIFGRSWLAPSQEAMLAQQVETAHVNSLMANHLTDVASTDQHTVKPWFDGKLDFSPPVVDLAAQGFPLIGGRLDYLDNHPAAALVYRRNQHVINLFIWPASDRSSALSASTINGYNLYQWNQSGMTFWAVSDLEKNQLKAFVELVQKNIR
jgi:anti-sigma factor RsiW